jgi:glutamine cyclotransferase
MRRTASAASLAAIVAASIPAAGCAGGPGLGAQETSVLQQGYDIVRVYPHDPDAFTQGLVVVDGRLFESAGRYGQSNLREVDLETGRVLRRQELEAKYFAEGLTVWRDALVQLTWTAGTAFVYDRDSFKLLRTRPYPGEGWGLTHDGRRLILSDGSPELRFLDPETFEETGRVTVRDGGQPIAKLNELEYVRGEILANVWETDRIARINPSSGDVTGWIDLSGLLAPGEVTSYEAVLNGIAYDAARDRLFVTGKLWPKLFEIRLRRPQR